MAPEQAMETKTADARADVYALGITLWYLLTGRVVFEGDGVVRKLMAHQNSPIPSLRMACPAVSMELEAVFTKMVAKDPGERYQSMREVRSDLERCQIGAMAPSLRSRSVDTSRKPEAEASAGPVSTEIEWVGCTTPSRMLDALRDRTSDRKLRLFACSCCRRIAHLLSDSRLSDALEATEQFLEGTLSRDALDRAHSRARAARDDFRSADNSDDAVAKRAAATAVMMMSTPKPQFHFQDEARQTFLMACKATSFQVSAAIQESRTASAYEDHNTLQDELCVHCDLLRDIIGNPFSQSHLRTTWLSERVVDLAGLIYSESAFDQMRQLGDALEESGCDDTSILRHCREPSVHVRGCWVIDEILGQT
jgi:hypothetical protein